MRRGEILAAADDLVGRVRAATHGDAAEGLGRVAALWSADLGIPVSAADVARLMAEFKLARALGRPGLADNWIDLVGYAAIGGELALAEVDVDHDPGPLRRAVRRVERRVSDAGRPAAEDPSAGGAVHPPPPPDPPSAGGSFIAGSGAAAGLANPFNSPDRLLAGDILAELARARAKLPGKNVTFAALVEEVGELATALFEEGAERVRKEAVQVAVMAMRVILDGDHVFEPWRREKGLDPLDPALRTTPEEA